MIGRRQWESIAEVVLCSGVPTQLVLAGLARLAGVEPFNPEGGLALPFVAVVALGDTVLLSSLIFWLLRRRGESIRTVFLGHRSQLPEFGLGVMLIPVLLIFISATIWLLRTLLPGVQNVPDNPLEALARSFGGAAVLMLVAVVAGGLREELQRAFLLHRFRSDLGGAVNGLILTSAAFGLGHLLQGWDAVIVTGLLGAFWGTLYFSRRSITAGVVSHGLTNAAQVAIAYAQKNM
jgi:membrane protease YdiL (CAAX protease family)